MHNNSAYTSFNYLITNIVQVRCVLEKVICDVTDSVLLRHNNRSNLCLVQQIMVLIFLMDDSTV